MAYEKVKCSVCGRKTAFPELKKNYFTEIEKFAQYCPKAESLAEREVNGVIQHCPNCGYVFLRIDEKTKIEKEQVQSKEYTEPFGPGYDGPKEAVQCFQLATTYQSMDCRRFAAQWYIYAAVIMGDGYLKERRICYKNALFLLEQELKDAKIPQDIEIHLAYLNLLRMLGLFDVAEEFGMQIKDQCDRVDKRLVEAILKQIKLKNTDYMTYVDLLFLELFNML